MSRCASRKSSDEIGSIASNVDVFGVDPTAPTFNNPDIDAHKAELAMSDVALVDRKTRNVPRATFDAIDSGTPLVFEADGAHASRRGDVHHRRRFRRRRLHRQAVDVHRPAQLNDVRHRPGAPHVAVGRRRTLRADRPRRERQAHRGVRLHGAIADARGRCGRLARAVKYFGFAISMWPVRACWLPICVVSTVVFPPYIQSSTTDPK